MIQEKIFPSIQTRLSYCTHNMEVVLWLSRVMIIKFGIWATQWLQISLSLTQKDQVYRIVFVAKHSFTIPIQCCHYQINKQLGISQRSIPGPLLFLLNTKMFSLERANLNAQSMNDSLTVVQACRLTLVAPRIGMLIGCQQLVLPFLAETPEPTFRLRTGMGHICCETQAESYTSPTRVTMCQLFPTTNRAIVYQHYITPSQGHQALEHPACVTVAMER